MAGAGRQTPRLRRGALHGDITCHLNQVPFKGEQSAINNYSRKTGVNGESEDLALPWLLSFLWSGKGSLRSRPAQCIFLDPTVDLYWKNNNNNNDMEMPNRIHFSQG